MADISKSNNRQDLPPLAVLPAFEAAARFGSFSKAAQHLGSSQPAISQQIRQLEQAVGQKLFRRKAQGVLVTEAGADLLTAVQSGFGALREVMQRLRQPTARTDLTVATDFAFAAYWLLPRLDGFKAEMPLVDVRILTAQHADDLGGANADVAILFGALEEQDDKRGKAIVSQPYRLFPESIFPVCSPAYAEGRQVSPDWLATASLLHLDDVVASDQRPQRQKRRWFGWADWFSAAGLDLPIRGPQLRFNNYTLALQAAMTGQGVALGWSPLVEPLLASGQLVAAHDFVVTSERGYIAELMRRDSVTDIARAFLAWLQREAAKTPVSMVIQSRPSTSLAPSRR